MSLVICPATCWACKFGHHPTGPHTWMDVEDIEFDADITMPTTEEEWAALIGHRPCGCKCEDDGEEND